MKRRLVIVVPVVVALVALGILLATHVVPSAHARSSRWSLVPNGPFDMPAGFCAFPVHGDILDNKEFVHTVTQPDGTVLQQITGTVKVRLTNTVNGKSVDLNVSGPGTLTIHPDGSGFGDGSGLGLAAFPASEQQKFGMPGIAYTRGLFVRSFAADGSTTGVVSTGLVTDACALLS